MSRLLGHRPSPAMVVALLALFMVAGSPAQAARKDSGVVDASKRVAGFTAGQLLGEEWRQLLELPPDANPLAGTGDNNCLSAGHKDKVLILWTTTAPTPPAVCDVKPGTPVFFYTLGGECSSVEPPPFFGATAEDQRRCILDWLRSTPFDAILVSIDGGPPGERWRRQLPRRLRAGHRRPARSKHLGRSRQPAGDLRRRGVLGAGSAAAPGDPHDHRDDRWRSVRWDHQPGGRQRRAGPHELTEVLLGRGSGRAVRAPLVGGPCRDGGPG
jgi:hypothetical protein